MKPLKKTLVKQKENEILLPAVCPQMAGVLVQVTDALGVPRDVLASDDEISAVWDNLPRVLKKITPDLRDAQIAKTCVAVAAGLFDGAINFIWNASVASLRNKIKAFGFNVISQIKNKPFEENQLNDLRDSELLELCLELNLIDEEGYFLLDQCRAIRNSFSAAHPSVGTIDDHEFLAFSNRCAKYALSDIVGPRGVDIQALIGALNGGRFVSDQLDSWTSAVEETHNAQRSVIFTMLHGIYCDPASAEDARVNAINLSISCNPHLTDEITSRLLNQHAEYLGKGDKSRSSASRAYFEHLELLNILSDAEQHSIISTTCKELYNVHTAWDNFYNEPPFAQRLLQVSDQIGIPNSVQKEFVLTVIACAIGNGHGLSRAAMPSYTKMIESFSPNEIRITIELTDEKNIISQRLKYNSKCRIGYKEILQLLDPLSIPNAVKVKYDCWMKWKP